MPPTRHHQRRIAAIAAAIILAMTGLSITAHPAQAADRDYLDIDVFAEIPNPGHPEGIAVSDDGIVYVSTDQQVLELPNGPSKVFAFDGDGTLLREYVLEGQAESSGTLGMEFDGNGVLYIVDRHPQRVIALDPQTGEQWDYATFSQVEDACLPLPVTQLVTECLYPDDLTFGPDGSMYVTDVGQNLLWRVPPGGGEAEVWYTDTRMFSPLGPNGIEFLADGETLMFAMTMTGPLDSLGGLVSGESLLPGTSKLFKLSLQPDGSPGRLETFWESRPADGIDGFGVGESGTVYAALGLANGIAAISPDGEEITRNPANLAENQLLDVPFDTPGNVKFLGDRMLVTNHAPFVPLPGTFVVFDVYAGEAGMPPIRPDIPTP